MEEVIYSLSLMNLTGSSVLFPTISESYLKNYLLHFFKFILIICNFRLQKSAAVKI